MKGLGWLVVCQMSACGGMWALVSIRGVGVDQNALATERRDD